MDTFSRPANERAAEGAVAVGTGRLEQVHLGRAGAWRAVLTSGEAWELAQARRQVTLHREPRRGEASVPPRQPPPLWVAGHLRSTSRACAVRSLPSTPPPPPPGSAGAGCRATVWSQTLDSGVPSRPGMGEGRGGVPAETPDSQEGLGVAENVSTALQGPQMLKSLKEEPCLTHFCMAWPPTDTHDSKLLTRGRVCVCSPGVGTVSVLIHGLEAREGTR
uniref:Uncharacterized protein LOC112831071 n=1 Tax=Callorhinus ursinus TaxID=34884 RepID=A0A3Q7Q499_CALUR|nr:uncharacterized protein LOC112831071 [Callorhinus ursinus]